MKSFERLLSLLFSIFAMVSGANSYRGVRTYIKVHRKEPNKAFEITILD